MLNIFFIFINLNIFSYLSSIVNNNAVKKLPKDISKLTKLKSL